MLLSLKIVHDHFSKIVHYTYYLTKDLLDCTSFQFLWNMAAWIVMFHVSPALITTRVSFINNTTYNYFTNFLISILSRSNNLSLLFESNAVLCNQQRRHCNANQRKEIDV